MSTENATIDIDAQLDQAPEVAPKPARKRTRRADPAEANNQTRTEKRATKAVAILQPANLQIRPSEARAARLARQGKDVGTTRTRGEKRGCTIEGCENRVHAKGLCVHHYNAARNGKAKAAREAAKIAAAKVSA